MNAFNCTTIRPAIPFSSALPLITNIPCLHFEEDYWNRTFLGIFKNKVPIYNFFLKIRFSAVFTKHESDICFGNVIHLKNWFKKITNYELAELGFVVVNQMWCFFLFVIWQNSLFFYYLAKFKNIYEDIMVNVLDHYKYLLTSIDYNKYKCNILSTASADVLVDLILHSCLPTNSNALFSFLFIFDGSGRAVLATQNFSGTYVVSLCLYTFLDFLFLS